MRTLFLTICLFACLSASSQEDFRLDSKTKSKISKISPESLNTIAWVETLLNKNDEKLSSNQVDIINPNIATVQQAFVNNKLSDKKISVIESLVCIDCYKEEWSVQQKLRDELIEKKELSVLKDDEPQMKLLESYRKMSLQQATDFAVQIANNTRDKWDVLDVDDGSKSLSVVFVNDTTSSKRRKQFLDRKEFPEKYEVFSVTFKSFMEGENKNLEIEGVKKYSFNGVTLKFLDIFPTWKQFFNKEATQDNVMNDYDARKVSANKGNWMYKFTPSNEPFWTIHKFY